MKKLNHPFRLTLFSFSCPVLSFMGMASLLVLIFVLGQTGRSFAQPNNSVPLTIFLQGSNTVIYWPLTGTDFQLETKSVLNPEITWSPVLTKPFLSGANYFVTNPAVEPKQFYRLHGDLPGILVQPIGGTNDPGATINLTVDADGSPPLSYLWRLNGVALLAETNSVLSITNLQLINCGSYEVVVANNVAAIVSQPTLVKLAGNETIFSDAFGGYPETSEQNGSFNGSNAGATKQVGEPNHAEKAGGKSVWFSWTPIESGIATFDTVGSAFDTLLAVYTGTNVGNLTNVVSDEDGAEFYRSTVKFNAVGGVNYQIAIDGFAGAAGNLVLNWNEEITPDTVPIILTQPTSRSVLPNTSTTFTVVAQGLPPLTNLFYRWQFNGVNISNAIGSSFTIPSVQVQHLGDYRVIVTNFVGRSITSAVASLQTATAQAGSVTNAFLQDKLEELFPETNGFPRPINGPKKPGPGQNFVSVSAGTLTIVSGTGGLTQSQETMPCAKIATGTLYVELRVGSDSNGKKLTVDTIGSTANTANTALKLRCPSLFTANCTTCNDNFSTGVTYSQVTTTIPTITSGFQTYRATIGIVLNSPASPPATVQLNVKIE